MSRNNNVQGTKENKANIILRIAIVIVAILVIILLIDLVVNGIKNRKKMGNTSGNMANVGYIAEDSKYLYFMCPSEDGKYLGISRLSKKDVSGKPERIIEGDWNINNINVYGDYIYFMTLADTPENEKDTIDNKIHRIKKNGKDHQVLNDNEMYNQSAEMAVVKKKIYYIGEDSCIWYMDLNGKNKTRLNENATGFDAITDKYILYSVQKVVDGEELSTTYIMTLNGKDAHEVTNDRLFNPVIYEDTVYYLSREAYFYKVGVDGKNNKMLTDARIYAFNVTDDGIFYISYTYNNSNEANGYGIYHMDLDGGKATLLGKIEDETPVICVTEDWIYYMDSDRQTEGRIELLSIDGKQKNIIYTLKYDNFYYLDDETEQEVTEDTPDEESTEEDSQITDETSSVTPDI